MSNEDDIVLYEKDGSTARLILNRPEKGNAMPLDGLDLLVDLLQQAEDDDDVSAPKATAILPLVFGEDWAAFPG